MLAALVGTCVLGTAGLVRAGVVAEGTYTISAPEHTVIGFRMVLTPTGARIDPTPGETLVFSYAKATALVIESGSHTYFPLPLELVPPLLAQGLGADPRNLGSAASGKTKKLLGIDCSEVVVTGATPKFSLRAWRVPDPAWSRDYTLLERSLGVPWAVADQPAVFVGIPLAGSVDIEGRRPYHASWVITKITHDDRADEDFTVPEGYQIDLQRLLSTQSQRR